MKLLFKIDGALRRAAAADLSRLHEFAYERVGFLYCRAARLNDGLMILVDSYAPVEDENYIRDDSVGARINSAAIRTALQFSLAQGVGIFHVHMHEHVGSPRPSKTDLIEAAKLVPDFFNVRPEMPHGTIILSHDSEFGLCWVGKSASPTEFHRIEVISSPLRMTDRYI